MRGCALGRFSFGHGGVEIADLVRHAHEFLDLARGHAAIPPPEPSPAVSKLSALSERATAIKLTPNCRALSRASEVGAERDTKVVAPKIATLTTISNEQRLEMTKNPSSELTPARKSAPIALSSALWRPTSSRASTIRPSRPHQAAPWTARVRRFSGWRSSSSSSAAPIAAGATGAGGRSFRRGEGI